MPLPRKTLLGAVFLEEEHEAVALWGQRATPWGLGGQRHSNHPPSQPCSHGSIGELSDTLHTYHTEVPGHTLGENTPNPVATTPK